MADPVSPIHFRVRCLGSVARDLLAASGRGRIAAVFKASFYLESAGELACLGNRSLGLGPLNAVTDAPLDSDWPALGLRPGERCSANGNAVQVGAKFVFALDHARVWRPPPCPGGWQGETIRRSLEKLERLAAARIPGQGLGSILLSPSAGRREAPVARAAREPVAGARAWLATAFRDHRWAATAATGWVGRLAGLGPGLTPSGDDLLGGIMIALHGLGCREAVDVLWPAVRSCAAEAQNPISTAHLAAAAEGLGSAAVHALFHDLVRGSDGALADRLDAIARIGHTSGWDALAGVVTVLRAWLDSQGADLVDTAVAGAGAGVAGVSATLQAR